MQIAIDKFKALTSYDLSGFLVKVDTFFTTHQGNIHNYYAGLTEDTSRQSFELMHELINEVSKVLQLYRLHKHSFKNTTDWDLLEVVETIKIKLDTTKNLNKYLRSSKGQTSYTGAQIVNTTTKVGDTLEQVAYRELGAKDYDNDWWDIAVQNKLTEDDYESFMGGNNLDLAVKRASNFILRSVIGSAQGDRAYGLDIKRKLTWVDSDFELLEYHDTAQQSIDILINLRKGDVPEFRSLGLDEKIMVGNTIANFTFPIMMRQLNEVFGTDDSFIDFNVKELKREKDGIILEFEINTFANKIKTAKLII